MVMAVTPSIPFVPASVAGPTDSARRDNQMRESIAPRKIKPDMNPLRRGERRSCGKQLPNVSHASPDLPKVYAKQTSACSSKVA